MMFNGFTSTFYTLELKSVSTNRISFERKRGDKGVIHKYQLDSLLKFSKYKNVVSGFLLDFRESNNTYFIDISQTLNMIDKINKKSFNENDLFDYCTPIKIEKYKLEVNYRYNLERFLSETSMAKTII